MSQQPLTYESVLEMIQKSGQEFDRKLDRMVAEFDRMLKENALEIKKTNKKTHKRISELSSSIGRVIENMVKGNIVDKFRALDYDVTGCSPRKSFKNYKLNIEGEIDLFLNDGDVAILISVKTTLETKDVRKHIESIEKYRQYAQARGICENQRFIGAVAGAVIEGEAAEFALQNGMYVIVQSGKAVDIIPTPEGFQAREW